MDISDSEDKNVTEKYIKSNKDLNAIGWADSIPLRIYQLSGVNWLIDCYKKEHGAILGDEMGLGKTCQTIAFILYNQRSKKKAQPSLVVCPRSVLENWEAEIKRFAPTLKVLCYTGDKEKRNELAQNMKNKSHNINILVTTYELCLKDSGFLSSIPWTCLVVDEAHRLKNNESQLHLTLKEWDIPHSVLLTGTPVQNNLQELYSLLSFIAPRKFRKSGQEKFVNKFSDMDKSGMKELHSLLKPYLLRRTKDEVLKDLPKKSEIVMFHGISKLQKKLYKAILTKDISAFETVNYRGEMSSPSLMNILMQLRKCVNHPYLFDGVEPEPFMIGDHLIDVSGKLALMDKMLTYLKSAGHKVLLFSQMTHMLDILQDYLGYRGYTYERLDGSVRGEERFIAVQNFNKNEDTFVFLLSTRAGGQGLNLVAADTVIFVDSDFNPQNDLQAAARAHRIGQTRPVKIVRLIGKNTVEEIILKRAEDKLKLTEKVIEEGEFSLGLSKQKLFTDDKVKLTDILKFGVEDLLKDDDSSELDLDFTELLGPTVGGEWQVKEEDIEDKKEADQSDEEMHDDQGPQSMYVFEGTDYSKEPSTADQKAFEELIEASRVVLEEGLGERSLRRTTSLLMGPLAEGGRKPRKQITPEEMEERKRKKKEAAEKKAKLAEEQEIRRAQERRKKMEDLWKANSYTSARVEVPSDEEDEEENLSQIDFDQEDDENKPRSRAIHYISGDVMKPVDTGSSVNLIVHCADDSGGWGKGGVFTAISKRSEVPEKQYELAGNLFDLALGDCHLIPLDEDMDEVDTENWLALLIAQHRDKRNNLSGIKLPALREGLQAVYYAAKTRSASVHLPRIGYDTPGFNWYGTERLIKKHLASKGIPTYIYYYPRRQTLLKRKTSLGTDSKKEAKKPRQSDQTTNSSVKSSPGLLDLFSNLSMYIHPDKFTADQLKTYRRYFIAYDGDIHPVMTETTKLVLVHPGADTKAIKLENYFTQIITEKWLEQCLQQRTCLSTDKYKAA
ncbi:chromodomain-helicase-DNA-binding protein 1-like isoform X3 [Mytilus galloprovincialis]|uniref:chromodomain-helicase-DNA-binding protein 1-like isoform X2 n=1 Tax=Mytilus galloprovincialis TaxID=29158 RepID=UPI003F7B692E